MDSPEHLPILMPGVASGGERRQHVRKPQRALIVSTNKRRGQEFKRRLKEVNSFLPASLRNEPLKIEEIDQVLESGRVVILFLDVENIEESLAIIQEVRRLDKGVNIVAFSRSITRDGLLQLIRESVHEWIGAPFEPPELEGILERVREQLLQNPPRFEREGRILSFLPAKAGCGTSTVVAHAAALAAEESGRRVALINLDLTCGIQGFLQNLPPSGTVADAADLVDRMDDTLWKKMVGGKGLLDVLRVGDQDPNHHLDPRAIQKILDFAESRYLLVFTDLSGNWERYADRDAGTIDHDLPGDDNRPRVTPPGPAPSPNA